MKKISVFAIVMLINFSCSQDDTCSLENTINLRINHYQNTGIGITETLTFMVQQEDELFSGNWFKFYNEIDGFEYEPGFVYNLSVDIVEVQNPGNDESSLRYILNEVISKKKVDNDVIFEIDLKINGQNFVTSSTENSNYEILGEICFDCAQACQEMNNMLVQQDFITGIFNRTAEGELQLIAVY
jgi:hypothetical protein